MKPGGIAVLSPAWNCRAWTVKKLQQRPFSELRFRDRVGKALIPIRENLIFRMFCALPLRMKREIMFLSRKRVSLEYRPLTPDFSLWDRYPHIADDDAFASIDAHAALTYFASRHGKVISHPTIVASHNMSRRRNRCTEAGDLRWSKGVRTQLAPIAGSFEYCQPPRQSAHHLTVAASSKHTQQLWASPYAMA